MTPINPDQAMTDKMDALTTELDAIKHVLAHAGLANEAQLNAVREGYVPLNPEIMPVAQGLTALVTILTAKGFVTHQEMREKIASY